jgi:hypothetical protein
MRWRVRVLPGEKAGAARRAERRGGEEVGEQRAFSRQPVEVGRRGEPVPRHAERIPTLIIGDDEDDIRPARLCVGSPAKYACQHRRAAQKDQRRFHGALHSISFRPRNRLFFHLHDEKLRTRQSRCYEEEAAIQTAA